MSFQDFPTTGTGKAATKALTNIAPALLQAMNPPANQGLMADCHVAVQGATLDINFGKNAAKVLSAARQAEVQAFVSMGYPIAQLDKMLFESMGNVPLGTNLHAAAVFEAARDNKAVLPQRVREWYTNALRTIENAELDLAITILENSTHVGCVPLAILKERKGLGTAVVGKLGFKHPEKATVTDWEFGGNGIRWV